MWFYKFSKPVIEGPWFVFAFPFLVLYFLASVILAIIFAIVVFVLSFPTLIVIFLRMLYFGVCRRRKIQNNVYHARNNEIIRNRKKR